MGKQARTITELSLKDLVRDLSKAYADEWLAHYLYWYMALTVSGKNYPGVSQQLKKLADEEKEHAEELADLILKLGGIPLANPMELEKNANAPYSMPPKNTADINRIIRVVMDAEAQAIDVYNKLAKKLFGKDHFCYPVITHILAEEIEHEQIFEGLLER